MSTSIYPTIIIYAFVHSAMNVAQLFGFRTFLLSLFLFNFVCSLKSIIRESVVPSGRKITNEIVVGMPSVTENELFNKLIDYNNWPSWISPDSKFRSDHRTLSANGQEFVESFGLWESSKITWEVTALLSNRKFKVRSKSSEGVFGWDSLELDFDLCPIEMAQGGVELRFCYSWIVSNPFVSVVEKLFVRSMMMADNEKAIAKLCELCGGKSL